MRISDWSSDVCSSDLAGRSIDLIECAFGPDEPLHGVDEAVAARLDSRGLIRRSHPGHGRRGLAGRADAARNVGRFRLRDRKNVGSGESVSARVDLGGRRRSNKKRMNETKHEEVKV